MSNLMYNETPVIGKYYKFGDWKIYAIHDENNIKGFFGEYRWLSNFQECPVFFEGISYPSSENAYQAAKIHEDFRLSLKECTPSQSKKEWKKYPKMDASKEDWNDRKYDVMSIILFDKFYRNPSLRYQLLQTGDKYLEELNHWSDVDWGVDIKLGGKNNLGKILMKIRHYWS